MTANEYSRLLTEQIQAVLKECREISRKKYYTHPICPWMTEAVLEAIRIRDHWHQKMKQNRGNAYYSFQYKKNRNKAVAMMRRQKKLFYCTRINQSAGNNKQL